MQTNAYQNKAKIYVLKASSFSQMSKPLYLGKMLLHWCEKCNVPVLGNECFCGNVTKIVSVTPPGDIRPAFPYDIEFINQISVEQFNSTLIPENKVIVLNKAPYDDRMDEIIMDGNTIGSIRFELNSLKWVLLLRVEGARLLLQKNDDLSQLKHWIAVDNSVVKFIIEGANLLAPGISDADITIKESDEVIILNSDNEVIATGRARMGGADMRAKQKGMAVKIRDKSLPKRFNINSNPTTWDDVIEANKNYIDAFIFKSHNFITNVASTVNKPITVSYSGGKDSLVVLNLVNECVGNYDILFADTGIEFPETVQNIDEIAKTYGKPIRSISSNDAFWDSISDFGPPSVEMRWCCKVCKLGPISQIIENNYENGCLTFIGQRKYESETRAKSERIWKNPWVGNQIGAAPIQDWTAMHVWLYIFMHNLPYNPLYNTGFDRIGCWVCPSCSVADLFRLKITHPQLADKLNDYLMKYAQKSDLSKEWINHGMWRWKKLPPNIQQIANSKGICTIPKADPYKKLEFAMTSGYRPCRQGGISAEGSFSTPIDLTIIKNSGLFGVIGPTTYIDGVASIFNGKNSGQIFSSGTVIARSDSDLNTKQLIKKIENTVLRALKCTGCGICVGQCSHNAIKIKNKHVIIEDNCIHCSKCIDSCPVIIFV